MKRLALIFFASVFLSATAPCAASAQEKPADLPLTVLSEDNLAFSDGEQLNYTFNYKWGMVRTDIAHGSLSAVKDTPGDGSVFHARMFARTAKFFDGFFKVREDFNSWFAADGMTPVRFTRNTQEGGYWCRNELEFVWDAPQPHINSTFESEKKGVLKAEMPIERQPMFDVISLIYAIRNMDMAAVQPGVPYGITFAVDDDVFNIALTFRQKEDRNVKGLGTVKALRFDVSVIAGEVFSGEESLSLWLSDDANRIPVYFEAAIKIGKVQGRLTSAEGLKHESVITTLN